MPCNPVIHIVQKPQSNSFNIPNNNHISRRPIPNNISNLTDYTTCAIISGASYLPNSSRQDYINKAGLQNLIIKDELSDEHIFTCFDDSKKTVIVGFRGTSLSSRSSAVDDLGSDVLVGLSLEELVDSRYEKSVRFMKDIVNEYNGFKIITTGHSLGAYLSYWMSRVYNLESYNYAMPSTLFEMTEESKISAKLKYFADKKKYSDKHIYSVLGDPIGMMSFNSSIRGDYHFVNSKSYNIHSILNFI